MQFVLVGADYEENLGMCMIAAAAESAGHRTAVVPFQEQAGRAQAVQRILALHPDVVGLAAQFQHRGLDYVSLACDLRHAGFRGHITAGGQFATMAADAILSGNFGVDSVVLYEGERTIVELLDAIAGNKAMTEVAGLALPGGKGRTLRTAPRDLAADLDELPLAHRYRQHSRQFGVPFIPVSGSRGCWAACSFCSITSVLRDGREHGVGGRRLRLRSPADVGLEMAMLAQAVGGSAVFCFHDENFLLPRPADSLERISAIKKVLDEQGVARAAFVGKCRPDTVTKDLARELARLGVFRMYVGIENASANGAAHLHRGTDVARMSAALDAFTEAGIFACYNLLLFEPDTTLDDVACNIAFMRAHAAIPVNFCRAEPYLGTPMHRRLQAAGKLQGTFLGCDYRIEDDRAEMLFRIAASVFREHNFNSNGVANRYMGLGYSAKLLEFFYPNDRGQQASFIERAQEITRSITLDTAELFEQALDLAAQAELADHDLIARKTALLGLRVAASDRLWHAAMDGLERDMMSFARGEATTVRRTVGRAVKAAQSAAMAGWLALWVSGPSGCTSTVDPLPPPVDARKSDVYVVDCLPPPTDARDGLMVEDPLPPPADARDGLMVADPLPPPTDAKDVAVWEVDPLPPPTDARDFGTPDLDTTPYDGGARDVGREAGDVGPDQRPPVVDPPPHASEGYSIPTEPQRQNDSAAREHWAFTTPVRMLRSQELPLCLCPEIRLAGEWQGGQIRARVSGATDNHSTRWQAQGQIDGDGVEVLWTPSSDEDQLDVAVRTRDGVAVTMLRLEQVAGRKHA